MNNVCSVNIPKGSAFQQFQKIENAYTDCYAITVPAGKTASMDLSTYINIFFDTWLFKLERKVLKLALIGKPVNRDLERFAKGEVDSFYLWKTDVRDENELLAIVQGSPIRSWLRIEPNPQNDTVVLYFGSAIVPTRIKPDGTKMIDKVTDLFTPIHQIYAKSLLKAAANKWRATL